MKVDLIFPVGDLFKQDGAVTELKHELAVDVSALDPDLKAKTKLTASLTLIRAGDSIAAILKGAKLVVELACLRCLTCYNHPLDLPDLERYFYLPQDGLEAEGEYFLIDPATNRIDLTEMLRQEIIFALPLRPLCQEKCLGLLSQQEVKGEALHQPLAQLNEFWQAEQEKEDQT
ncbi:MAG: hypothetical protein A2788_02605 [Candidatus Abawacabacteria bacterium RIFCSPHIGHO2_01_FULL_46_8]|uniref:DUF177 domain-containing protein n=1 Tax=Candidatus Abawacabacteria bacterium RIFCSPHIGHO2_01_FULL_46_8 TaxID=1817815 RepID=A0A1F4XM89_9BACT|nr:MAG: hypothetical protein A2788_02605 [Candidatus Abawacabacteria bacterium RIFCSPHIGHO2_01_FULL_46_8]